MTDLSGVSDAGGTGSELVRELRKEASTMALYIAVSLLAALMAIPNAVSRSDARFLGIIWGTTIGLAVAHLFAFRLSARLVGSGQLGAHDGPISAAQLFGAATVALVCTLAVVVLPGSSGIDGVRIVLAGYVSLVGYQVAMSNGSTRVRAFTYAVLVLVSALAIAVTKNVLSGH